MGDLQAQFGRPRAPLDVPLGAEKVAVTCDDGGARYRPVPTDLAMISIPMLARCWQIRVRVRFGRGVQDSLPSGDGQYRLPPFSCPIETINPRRGLQNRSRSGSRDARSDAVSATELATSIISTPLLTVPQSSS
jgi:hypothetical protein